MRYRKRVGLIFVSRAFHVHIPRIPFPELVDDRCRCDHGLHNRCANSLSLFVGPFVGCAFVRFQ